MIESAKAVSDVDGVSAQEMTAAIIKGSPFRKKTEQKICARIKSQKLKHIHSFDGKLNDRHRFLLEHPKIVSQVDKAIILYQKQWQLLQPIPGADKTPAAILLAEIGEDMSLFGNKDRLIFRIEICSGKNESIN